MAGSLGYNIVFSDFWENKFFSNSIKLLSHYVSVNFLYWAPFFFRQGSLFGNSISLSFDLF